MSRTVLLCLAFAAACSSGGGTVAPPPPPPPPGGQLPTQAQVSMTTSDDGYGAAVHTFSPGLVSIARNGTVTWVNSSIYEHNVTFSTTGAPSNIPNLASGSVARAFPAAGTFAYYCSNHAGMTGQVVVQ